MSTCSKCAYWALLSLEESFSVLTTVCNRGHNLCNAIKQNSTILSKFDGQYSFIIQHRKFIWSDRTKDGFNSDCSEGLHYFSISMTRIVAPAGSTSVLDFIQVLGLCRHAKVFKKDVHKFSRGWNALQKVSKDSHIRNVRRTLGGFSTNRNMPPKTDITKAFRTIHETTFEERSHNQNIMFSECCSGKLLDGMK